jgi:hypothetical protein
MAMMQVADKNCGGVLRGASTDACPTSSEVPTSVRGSTSGAMQGTF